MRLAFKRPCIFCRRLFGSRCGSWSWSWSWSSFGCRGGSRSRSRSRVSGALGRRSSRCRRGRGSSRCSSWGSGCGRSGRGCCRGSCRCSGWRSCRGGSGRRRSCCPVALALAAGRLATLSFAGIALALAAVLGWRRDECREAERDLSDAAAVDLEAVDVLGRQGRDLVVVDQLLGV